MINCLIKDYENILEANGYSWYYVDGKLSVYKPDDFIVVISDDCYTSLIWECLL